MRSWVGFGDGTFGASLSFGGIVGLTAVDFVDADLSTVLYALGVVAAGANNVVTGNITH